MSEKKDSLVKVEYIIPKSIEKEIAKKISEQVKNSYYWNVTKAVSDRVVKQLNSDGFTERVAEAVISKIKISEDDYINGVTEQVKDALIKTTGIIAKEVLEKVQGKIQSYGFIKIGDRF